jgi:replicative DNA helicase
VKPQQDEDVYYDFNVPKYNNYYAMGLFHHNTGKTTFVTNIVFKASKKHKVMIFALEDRLQDYGIKAVYFELGKIRHSEYLKNYPWNDYRKNNIDDPRYLELRKRAENNLENENILFEDCPDLIDLELLEKIIEKRSSEGIDLFVIDHLHYFDLLKGENSKADYVERMMIRIKKLQIRTGARIIMVAHYRKLDGRKPSLDSFKDSISICQNANYVINLWRDRSENAIRTETKIMIPKSRNPNGECTITATFNPETNDFEHIDSKFGVETANKELDDKYFDQ